MLKHIVMFRFNNQGNKTEKQLNIRYLKERLEILPSMITEILGYEVGENEIERLVAWDLVLTSVFQDEEKLQVYMEHPEHQKILDIVDQYVEDKAVVDYYF
jgi:hypothetical protein